MVLKSCRDDNGYAFYIKGHVDLADFMSAVAIGVDPDDPILSETPVHCWMRVCRDFSNEASLIAEATPNSRGAFKCTWIQLD